MQSPTTNTLIDADILNQQSSPTCMNFAVCTILQRYWVKFDLDKIAYIRVPYIQKVEKLFVDAGLIKKFVKIPTPKLVDLWLNKWEWLITSTSRGDFTIHDNDGNIIEFDEKSQHAFVLIWDCGDRWEMQNVWGKEWNWNGRCFIMKKDFKYLMTPRRVILK